ncbi:hypothetical protein [Saccharopolyspora hattusasensis]|uniref:hypothetical protein n=1 Tax=Saccharopolyspora hattusasensis TaxID=1128679 RepID=UPI003D97BF45
MRVVLARRRTGSPLSGPPEVHVYQVADTSTTEQALAGETGRVQTGTENGRSIWIAVCGDRLAPGDAELVETYGGAPCAACYLALAAVSTVASVDRSGEFSSLVTEVPSESGFSISWRERLVHRVTVESPRREFDGRQVVAGLCGRLGWGPVENAPAGWPVCVECDDIAQQQEGT